ncbi:hypothetical protein N7468_008132 [Penicillium chermesinum]|uniref:SUN domain-containing protein n=1 Tax=Penicillium chermesinum TaxID=63820 RepID=A0A9W9NPB8_9EURO|nr:uncharacterized protein N7468_008132 [Penicillium chermesinum]KAJ5223590.1 hypothetical protein N7468_008132 [Penicillium chermesinum]
MAGSRTFRSRRQLAAAIFALAGCVAGQQTAPESLAQPARGTVPETCPAKSIWVIEAEIFQYPVCLDIRLHPSAGFRPVGAPAGPGGWSSSFGGDSAASSVAAVDAATKKASEEEQEQDTDSLLDSESFLSFEDWKKQNLAKVGQSAENVGGSRRAAAAGKEGRQQPGIQNALDSLGDDAEIELDFGGFGGETPEASPAAWASPISAQYSGSLDEDVNAGGDVQVGRAQSDVSRRKDAGTTCKERFNYASFDCAATVLKTNPECTGSSAVLVEHKDSYMLNECRADNKFLILELCDDILVDTVVLANYEFFSSIFHTFRVSVSDRYPAKPDQWKELGVYQARNTREVQAFAVENSLIWARYLRIEFLTHYGTEFYCPLSLIRVHGTTMLEEYKHDESASQADSEIEEPVAAPEVPQISESVGEPAETLAEESTDLGAPAVCAKPLSQIEVFFHKTESEFLDICDPQDQPAIETKTEHPEAVAQSNPEIQANATSITGDQIPATQPGSISQSKLTDEVRRQGDSSKPLVAAPDTSEAATEPNHQNSSVESTGKSTTKPKEEQPSAPPETIRATSTQPPSSNPTTQESFFKSVHKRLQMLESNSTLSLLYIEEQSRILRDAFNKVEKRQLAKTSTFLENLNVTVLNELKEFREQYDHVWKSVAFEFEHRMRYHEEVQSLSAQLGILADEIVFQKRVTVIQSIMVLCCFAFVLFSRGSVSNYMEFPRVQRMVARSYSLRPGSPIYSPTSPSGSPGSTRPTSSRREDMGHRRNLSDSSSPDEAASPGPAYVPPTPTSEVSRELGDLKVDVPRSPDSISEPTPGTPHLRSHSTPPVLTGHISDLDRQEEAETYSPDSDVSISIRSDESTRLS